MNDVSAFGSSPSRQKTHLCSDALLRTLPLAFIRTRTMVLWRPLVEAYEQARYQGVTPESSCASMFAPAPTSKRTVSS